MIDAPIDPRQDCDRHMTLEHIVPLSHGGTHDLSNLALACFECNNARASDLEWSYEVVDEPDSVESNGEGP
jgi:5-methylcytosine-specific restriction endonuclease McrA